MNSTIYYCKDYYPATQPRCAADTAGAVSTWVRFTPQTAVASLRAAVLSTARWPAPRSLLC
jgi:hypothetical protein